MSKKQLSLGDEVDAVFTQLDGLAKKAEDQTDTFKDEAEKLRQACANGIRALLTSTAARAKELESIITSESDTDIDLSLLRQRVSGMRSGTNTKAILELLLTAGVGVVVPIQDIEKAIRVRGFSSAAGTVNGVKTLLIQKTGFTILTHYKPHASPELTGISLVAKR